VIADTVHVHLKDGRHVDGKWEHAIVGEGDVGVADVLRALRDGPYDGWIALETHYRPKPTGADLTRPGGSALSELGEEGTRACLIGWNRALELL
jgi:sugar phosphate isomerase/epimerase